MISPHYQDYPGPQHQGQQPYYPHDPRDFPGDRLPYNYGRDQREQGRYPHDQDGRAMLDQDSRRGDYDFQDGRNPRTDSRNYRQDPRDYGHGDGHRERPQQQQQYADYDKRFNNSYDRDTSRDTSFDKDPYYRGDKPRDNLSPNNQYMDGRKSSQMDDKFRQGLPNGGPQGSPHKQGMPPSQYQDKQSYSTNSIPRSQAAEQYQRVSILFLQNMR